MKTISMVFLALAYSFSIQAQSNWSSIGNFNGLSGVDRLWYDSVDQRLYAAGSYTWFDSTEVHGFGYIQGDTLIPLGCGFGNYCGTNLSYNSSIGSRVFGFARFNGELYVTGSFAEAGGVTVNGIAKWGGNDWVPVGSGLSISPFSSNDHPFGNGLEVMNGELYVYGFFESINGIRANGIAKFDGTEWSSVFGFPQFGSIYDDQNQVSDAEWYCGDLFVGGNFKRTATSPPDHNLLKWNGSSWDWVQSPGYGPSEVITTLLTWDSKLVVAGRFNVDQSNKSQILTWDGKNWGTLRGGIRRSAASTIIFDVQVHKGNLYVAGIFDNAGGQSVRNFARWDGKQWCGNDGPEYNFRSFTFVEDTLFLSMGWGIIDAGDSSATDVVKWVSGEWEGASCQARLPDSAYEEELAMVIFPNPTESTIRIKPMLNSAISLKFWDYSGRVVWIIPEYWGSELGLSGLAAGIYIVEMRKGDQVQILKLVKSN